VTVPRGSFVVARERVVTSFWLRHGALLTSSGVWTPRSEFNARSVSFVYADDSRSMSSQGGSSPRCAGLIAEGLTTNVYLLAQRHRQG
jgi:hypothetical protein